MMGPVLRLVMGIFLRLTQAVLSLFTQDAQKKPKFAYGLCDFGSREFQLRYNGRINRLADCRLCAKC